MVKKFTGVNVDTHAVWIPAIVLYEVLKGSNTSGIRIYLANYHNNAHNKIGRDSFVITTVGANDQDDFSCATPLVKYRTKVQTMWGNTQNNGALCPINCN